MKRGFVSERDAAAAPVVSDASEHVCANCGANAPDRFCPECGQDTRDRLPTSRTARSDGRYPPRWQAVKIFQCCFAPAFTRAYLAGKRFIGPARLFSSRALVLFAVPSFAAESMDILSWTRRCTRRHRIRERCGAGAKPKARHAEEDFVVLDRTQPQHGRSAEIG